MIGLSLSGGGAKGAFEVGVLEYLCEAIGAPADSQVARTTTYISASWDRLAKTRQVWRKTAPWNWLSNPNIGDNSPLRETLGELLPANAHDLVMQGVPVEFPGWDLESGKAVWFKSREAKCKSDLISMVMASASFPIAFPPEARREGFITDGGITVIQPIEACVRAGCSAVLAVSCRNPDHPEKVSRAELATPLDTALRCLDGMENDIAWNDVKMVALWNALVEAKHPLATGKRTVRLDHIAPSAPLGNPLDFSASLTERRRAQGRRDAKQYFDHNPDSLDRYRNGFSFGAGCSVGAVNILGLAIQPLGK